ncbi:MAG: RlmE family RNA methyltransferase [Rhodospirillales bacterium]|nr:RlmE family RNA methyltransferase [Rhodospirillales bacterium]
MSRNRTGATRFAGRGAKARVRTARQRTASSTRWLQRQINDPYVAEAARRGLRSRAAFKLAELDGRFRLFKPGAKVVDLGAAPGGWTQVALERVGPSGRVAAVDLRPMDAIAGATILEADLTDPATPAKIRDALGGPADVVLSDMSPAATGHGATDHLRIVALAEAAFAFAREILKPGGAFVAKVFQGGAEGALLADLKRSFATVRHAKPPASRSESAETYVVAQGFRVV